MPATLIYCYDPMCSWCWGFKPTWQTLCVQLQSTIAQQKLSIEHRVGGLAPDSETPMEPPMAAKLQSTWRNINDQLGTEFNHEFWQNCKPRRSTYPACRACLVARSHGLEHEIVSQIQHAYYLNAKNPSDIETLAECAKNIGIDRPIFMDEMSQIKNSMQLEHEIQHTRMLGLNTFPSLAVVLGNQIVPIAIDYQDASIMTAQITQAIAALAKQQ